MDRAASSESASAVVTCSALRRVYRDLLREGRPAGAVLPRQRRPGPDRRPAERRARATTCRPRCCPASSPRSSRSSRTSRVWSSPRRVLPKRSERRALAALGLHDHGSRPVTHRTSSALAACRGQQRRPDAAARRRRASGIATVVLLITAAKFHPFLALILGTAALGVVAAVPAGAIVDSFTKGFGDDGRHRRPADRARRDDRQAARRLRRRRPRSSTRIVGRVGARGCPGRWP